MNAKDNKNCLLAKSLSKSYKGRKVVSNTSLQVERGEVVGLLGPNGAGKTTSFYMIVGLVKADAGEIYLGEQKITGLPIHKRARLGVGYLPQEASIFRDLTVEENLLAVLELRPLRRAQRQKRCEELLQDFGLLHIRNGSGRQLSGGERRRVEIARCLALDPSFVLLDEPFAGVDPLAVGDIQRIVADLKTRNIGVLITDHSVRETLGIVDRGYIMNEGELLISGTPQEILESEEARKFYLGEEFRM